MLFIFLNSSRSIKYGTLTEATFIVYLSNFVFISLTSHGLNTFRFSSRLKLFFNPGFVDFYTIEIV